MTDAKTPETKLFHLGDILTVITGIMVSSNGAGGVHELLDYMTGEQLFTHQLPRAIGQCAPILKELYPGLAAIEIPNGDYVLALDPEVFWPLWLDQQISRFGEMLPVQKLTNYTAVDPITELLEMKPDAEIILLDPESLESEAKYVAERLADSN